jgi:thiamine-phosphate pyrophosphorylase
MICLVTDRRRLVAAAAAAAPGAPRACLVAQVRHAVDAGIDLIQVRERDLEAGELAALVTELLAVTRDTPTRLVVNDRIDVALACGADGVHLRGDSIPIPAARRLAPAGFLIGRSVHGVDEAIGAVGADYLIAGMVFSSASKPGQTPLLGVEGLRAIAAAVEMPVLAIGGIAGDRINDMAAAGAAGFAAIELFMGSHHGAEVAGCRVVELRQTVKNARSRFDRLNTTP